MRLAMIGTGYVGLVAGAGFADFGNDVICVDSDELKVARLERGELPIYEPGLDVLVARSHKRGNLRFSSNLAEAVEQAEVVFIAVGTPASSSGAADLSAVMAVADAIGPALGGYTVVVNKSTVPVGTAERVRSRIAAHTRQPFAVVANPEFLKEGDAINDFMKPNRVILGSDDERAREILRQLYAPFTRTNDRLQCMDPASAELAKYANNAMLAVRISFMNELALLAEKLGADIEQVRLALGADPRIGAKFLYAGAGYGGSCFPKDLKALLHTAELQESSLELVAAAERVNERQKQVLGEKIARHFEATGGVAGKAIAVWGLAFKPGTDDLREAPATVLIAALLAAGAKVMAHDPVAGDNARALWGERVTLAPSMYHAAEGADALVLVTEWHELRRPDFVRLRALMRAPVLFDGRNVWDAAEVRSLGFTYHGIGRR
ncbi:MAG: rkpK [Myxococcales bacterium]|nr:rkpK [Myxococcales bacterium]